MPPSLSLGHLFGSAGSAPKIEKLTAAQLAEIPAAHDHSLSVRYDNREKTRGGLIYNVIGGCLHAECESVLRRRRLSGS